MHVFICTVACISTNTSLHDTKFNTKSKRKAFIKNQFSLAISDYFYLNNYNIVILYSMS